MSWELIGKPSTVRVTKKLAKEFAEMDAAPNDRPLSERRLQVYERIFKDGGFRPCTWAKAICAETNGIYRVNGKHTSTFLSGLETLPEYYVTIEEYQCDTLEDVARLYATFDSKMQSRTTTDINASFAGTVDVLRDLPRTDINLLVSGLGYATWGHDVYNHQPTERAELMLEHVDFALWLNQMFHGYGPAKGKDRVSIRRAAVVAAMFQTWKKAKTQATEFWIMVREETGDHPTDPDRKLAKYLSTTGLIGGNRRTKAKVSGNREMYVKCLHAWNAWRNEEATNLNYHPEAKVPAVA